MDLNDILKHEDLIPAFTYWWEMMSEDPKCISNCDYSVAFIWWVAGATGEVGPQESLGADFKSLENMAWSAGFSYAQGKKSNT